jgi:hypothetical protein
MPRPNYQSTMKEQNPFTPREKNNSRNEANLLVNIGITNVDLDLIMHTGHHSPQWMLDESDKWGATHRLHIKDNKCFIHFSS